MMEKYFGIVFWAVGTAIIWWVIWKIITDWSKRVIP